MITEYYCATNLAESITYCVSCYADSSVAEYWIIPSTELLKILYGELFIEFENKELTQTRTLSFTG